MVWTPLKVDLEVNVVLLNCCLTCRGNMIFGRSASNPETQAAAANAAATDISIRIVSVYNVIELCVA